MTTLLKRKHVLAASRGSASLPFGGLVSTVNLVSYWKLSESSGQRMDSFGTNHLTPTNNPTSAIGKIGNACDFEFDAAQFLSVNEAAPLGDESFTYTLWFKRETFPSNQILFGKDTNTSRQYALLFTGSTQDLTFTIYGGTSAVSSALFANDTNWHFLVAWHDAVTNTVNLQMDNGTIFTNSYATNTMPAAAIPFYLGARQYPTFENYFDGLIDEVGLWRRVLTPTERTALYNSGNGLTF